MVLDVVRWAGAAFLLGYAVLALRRAVRPGELHAATGGARVGLRPVLTTAAALTFLNPHVYLDTVLLLGSIANQHGDDGRWYFAAGAVLGQLRVVLRARVRRAPAGAALRPARGLAGPRRGDRRRDGRHRALPRPRGVRAAGPRSLGFRRGLPLPAQGRLRRAPPPPRRDARGRRTPRQRDGGADAGAAASRAPAPAAGDVPDRAGRGVRHRQVGRAPLHPALRATPRSTCARREFTLLEIGVGGYTRRKRSGASLKMWRWFFPRATIVGLDIEDKSFIDQGPIVTYRGDQTDPDVFRRIFEERGVPLVVIDDGSHVPAHVRETFAIALPAAPRRRDLLHRGHPDVVLARLGRPARPAGPGTSMDMVKDLVDGLNHEEFLVEGYEPTLHRHPRPGGALLPQPRRHREGRQPRGHQPRHQLRALPRQLAGPRCGAPATPEETP